jgi:hypothetical protein
MKMTKTLGWFIAVLMAVVAVALLVDWAKIRKPEAERTTPPPVADAPPPPAIAEPQISYPVPAGRPPESGTLPALNDSDTAFQHALVTLIGKRALAEFVRFPDVIRRIVVTVDNLPRRKVAQRLLPIKNVPGRFLVSGDSEKAAVHPQNSARYGAYLQLAEAIDTTTLVGLYVRFYPLFQQAYVELGYPKGYFNDRLVAVIDDLLAAPELTAPPQLVQPKVMYEFADRALEALSAGQKILIRMGSAHAARVKAKLRAVRAELVGLDSNRPG